MNVILDIGANRGQSIASLRAVFPEATIHAFEANPAFFQVLTGLAQRLPGPLEVHRFGLGRENASLRFHIPWVGEVAYLEESSTRLDYFDKPWVVEKFRARGVLRLEEIAVDVRIGDELGLHPDLVKIDVEGAEHDVLLGLRRTIETCRPFLPVENSEWHNVTAFLAAIGYRPFRWDGGECALVPFHGATTNTFYIHPDRRDGLPIVEHGRGAQP